MKAAFTASIGITITHSIWIWSQNTLGWNFRTFWIFTELALWCSELFLCPSKRKTTFEILHFLKKYTAILIIQREGVKWPPYMRRNVNRKTRNISCSPVRIQSWFSRYPASQSGRDMKLTVYLHLVPSLRMAGAMPPALHIFSWLYSNESTFMHTLTQHNMHGHDW
jgi:hypothetical protein